MNDENLREENFWVYYKNQEESGPKKKTRNGKPDQKEEGQESLLYTSNNILQEST